MNKEDLKRYKSLVHFMGQALGPSYEIVLHVIDGDDSYVAAIENGDISGRSEDAPLTDLALSLIKNETYKTQDSKVNYKGRTRNNNEIQGSTYFIKDDKGALEGMICINVDLQLPKQLAYSIFRMINVDIDGFDVYNNNDTAEVEEFFPESIRDILYSIVDPSLLDSRTQIKPSEIETIIYELDKRGVFQLKGAVNQVSELLNMSEPSVYRYLKKAKGKNN